MNRREYIAICDRLSTAELIDLLGLHADFCLPRESRDWQRRMDAAFGAIDRERCDPSQVEQRRRGAADRQRKRVVA